MKKIEIEVTDRQAEWLYDMLKELGQEFSQDLFDYDHTEELIVILN